MRSEARVIHHRSTATGPDLTGSECTRQDGDL
jgi:hypothetical protein